MIKTSIREGKDQELEDLVKTLGDPKESEQFRKDAAYKTLGDPKESEQFRKDAAYFSVENCRRLQERYQNQFVGVHRGEIVAHARDFRDYLKQLQEQGLPGIPWTYIPAKGEEDNIILQAT